MSKFVKKSIVLLFSPLIIFIALICASFRAIKLVIATRAIDKRFKTHVIGGLPKCYANPHDLIDFLSNRVLFVLNARSQNDLESKISIFSIQEMQQIPGFYQNESLMFQLIGNMVQDDIRSTFDHSKLPKINYTAELCIRLADTIICEELLKTVMDNVLKLVGPNDQYNEQTTNEFVISKQMKQRLQVLATLMMDRKKELI